MTDFTRPAGSSRALFIASCLFASSWLPAPAADAPGARLELQPGDRVCIIGNALPERMQFDGWFETVLHARFPTHDLVFRNLGYSGDELKLRLRPEGFGSPDEHLTRLKADVVMAFFGFNESFAGPAGLEKFKASLDDLVKDTLAKKYNGRTAPRLVLFSSIAHEDLRDPHLPDGSENNRNIELYTAATAEVARARGVPFVDLFAASREMSARADKPLTINGIHLNEEGNRLLAEAADRALFGGPPANRLGAAALADLRTAVVDKCFYWHQRHRIVDGYSVYGGRSWLKFVDGQTNREVMDRELEVLDVMTANRDRRVWARAQGKDLAVNDANTPPFIPVKTNKPGPGPDGAHLFLGGEEAIGKMTVGKGMKVTLFASEEKFPLLAKPVQMAFDARGRLFVAVMPSYPHWKPKDEMDDKVLIIEDVDGDARADSCRVFADKLHVPTGMEFWGGGLYVGLGPYLIFLKDTDGDDRADFQERVLHGIDTADTHHTISSFVVDPGGALYMQEGTFHHSQVETLWGPQRCANAGVFRYEPRTQRFDVYVSYPFANPHGHVFDRWGQDFVTDGTGNANYYAAAFSGRLDFPAKHPGMRTIYQQRDRPCPATEILSSRHFPDEMQGTYLDPNVIGYQGILQYRLRDDGAGFSGEIMESLVSSSDASFRPVDLEIAPDGSLYFLDWQNPIIGHMQHHLRDPSRDHTHGRIYRLTYPSRPLLEPKPIAGQPVDKLLALLQEPEDRVRSRARMELSTRSSTDVIPAAAKWMAALDLNDPQREHHLLEGLWLHQAQDVVEPNLLKRLLRSEDFRARAAAVRVLCYWRDRIPDSLDLLKKLAADPYPRVRLEAVRAASYYREAEAIEVPLISTEQPSDYYLDYTREETMRALEPYWKQAIAEGRQVPATSPAGKRFFLERLSTADLLRLERDPSVCTEILTRRGVEEERRREALRDLARLEQKSELSVLLATIERIDDKSGGKAGEGSAVLYDLAALLAKREPGELRSARADLERLAVSGRLPVTRQVAFVALVVADGLPDAAWKLGLKSTAALQDFVSAVPLIPDASLRAGLYPRMDELLDGLPRELAVEAKAGKAARGRYVRIELPGRSRTLTLAEVEVKSEGREIARQGKASQKNTANGGEASRAIDGNTSGSYGSGGQTHTREETSDPWWELDLGGEHPIDSVVVYNRTDGDLGKRLDGFTLKVLDGGRGETFLQKGIAAPAPKAAFQISPRDPASEVRQAAMGALTQVRGQEKKTFSRLAKFAREGIDRGAALRALERIPPAHWPAEEVRPLFDSVLAYVRALPAAERTSPAALEALQLGEALAAQLPGDDSRRARAEIGQLGVRVIRLGTVPHQMVYDKDSFAVAAGKPLEIILENTDLMPHNLVVGKPGSMESIGVAAEAMAMKPEAPARHYVPRSPNVIVSTKLLQPRDIERLSFTAPEKPAVYPYLCTYPGHWRRMFGAMYVVEDLEGYLQNPTAYLEAHPLPIEDELLKFRRPRREWKLDELSPGLGDLAHGRTFGNGKQMFQVASCVACHRLDGAGLELGPDLAQLDPKLTPADILKDMLEPSFKINEKFQGYTFVTKDGKVLTGLVVSRSPETIKIVENALIKPEPTELKVSSIAQELKSPTSTMPEGLLNQLTREEIFDLLAFVIARGNRSHQLFQGSCGLGAGEHALPK